MEKVKVLHYIPSFQVGGIESLFMQWNKHIDAECVSQELLVWNKDIHSELMEQFKRQGGVCHIISPFSAKSMGTYREGIKEFFKNNHDFDILHVHDEWDLFVFYYARKYGIKHIIVHAHSIRSRYSLFKSLRKHILQVYRYCSRFLPNHYFACSKAAAISQFGKRKVNNGKVEIIKNTISAEKYRFCKETREAYRAKIGVENRFVLGHIGRMAREKNYSFLLHVFRKILELRKDAILVLIGDGPERKEIEQLSSDFGIEENIIFLGMRYDIPQLMQAIDLVIFPSSSEGFGLVLIEAQAASVRCLVSDIIQQEVFITPLIERLSLSDTPDRWAKRAVDIGNVYKRDNMEDDIYAAGFDSKDETEHLQALYVDIVNKGR